MFHLLLHFLQDTHKCIHRNTFTKRISKKYMNHVTHTPSSADISIFSPEISKFCCIKKYRYRLHFDTQFLLLLTFLESLKIFLINMVIILMMPSKMATQGFPKITIFLNKGCGCHNSCPWRHLKRLSRVSSYIIDVVM